MGVAVVILDGLWPHFALVYAVSKEKAERAKVEGIIPKIMKKIPDHKDEQKWKRMYWDKNQTLLMIPKWYMFRAWIRVFRIRLVPGKITDSAKA